MQSNRTASWWLIQKGGDTYGEVERGQEAPQTAEERLEEAGADVLREE